MQKGKVIGICAFLLALILFSGYLYSQRVRGEPSSKETITAGELTGNVCPYTFVSWNLANFGQSKSHETIDEMAVILRHADIIAVQEVTAGKNFGAKAVEKLSVALSRTGNDWDTLISDPTSPASPGVERYAYLFKKSSITTNRDKAHLVGELKETIDREPYAAVFKPKRVDEIAIYTMHAVPTAKNPINEIRALKSSQEIRAISRAIFSGDFNLGKVSTDPIFTNLGFVGHINEPTSLKAKVSNGSYKVKQYDNIYTKGIHVCNSGVMDFVRTSYAPVTNESLQKARRVSDHLPVFITFR